MVEGMADVHNSAPDAFDDALAGAEVQVTPGNPDIAVTATVPVDGRPLDRLTERAEREGRDIEQVVADALRAGRRSDTTAAAAWRGAGS